MRPFPLPISSPHPPHAEQLHMEGEYHLPHRRRTRTISRLRDMRPSLGGDEHKPPRKGVSLRRNCRPHPATIPPLNIPVSILADFIGSPPNPYHTSSSVPNIPASTPAVTFHHQRCQTRICRRVAFPARIVYTSYCEKERRKIITVEHPV